MNFDKPKISPSQITQIIEPYNLGAYRSSQSLGGIPNTTFKITTDQQVFALRVYSIGQSSNYHIKKEIEILEHLKNQNFPSPRPLRGKNGQYLQYWGKYPLLATEFIDGEMAENRKLTPMLSHNIGALLNQYRSAMRTFITNPIPKAEHLLNKGTEVVSDIESDLKARGWTMQVSDVPKIWHEAASQIVVALPMLDQEVLHSDFWPPNFKVIGDTIVGLMDFDDWSYGPAFFDLVVAFQECAMFNSDEINQQVAVNIFKGYFETGGKLSGQELFHFPTAIQLFSALFLSYNIAQAETFEEAHIYLKKLNRVKNEEHKLQFRAELEHLINQAKANQSQSNPHASG